MADRPILFSAPMIRALLDGRKSQTRRIAKFVKPHGDLWHVCNAHGGLVGCTDDDVRSDAADYAPYAVGDRLWCRETWKPHSLYDQMKPRDMPVTRIFYLADGGYSPSGSRGRPGIHMPRWASRLTLIVTEVRVQRLQEISAEDARDEGLSCLSKDDGRLYKWGIPDRDGLPGQDDDGWPWREWRVSPVDAFAALWNSINGEGAWASNPWVAAYTFTVHRCNIDALANGDAP